MKTYFNTKGTNILQQEPLRVKNMEIVPCKQIERILVPITLIGKLVIDYVCMCYVLTEGWFYGHHYL